MSHHPHHHAVSCVDSSCLLLGSHDIFSIIAKHRLWTLVFGWDLVVCSPPHLHTIHSLILSLSTSPSPPLSLFSTFPSACAYPFLRLSLSPSLDLSPCQSSPHNDSSPWQRKNITSNASTHRRRNSRKKKLPGASPVSREAPKTCCDILLQGRRKLIRFSWMQFFDAARL